MLFKNHKLALQNLRSRKKMCNQQMLPGFHNDKRQMHASWPAGVGFMFKGNAGHVALGWTTQAFTQHHFGVALLPPVAPAAAMRIMVKSAAG